ncbi:MAG: hypothetical protein DRP87_03825 [Spirochaetes bacterium]|nr:MAG: hypothetical protein DRP87_03825 [Spirochaetota bacterium]
MASSVHISPELEREIEEKKINAEETLKILSNYNKGAYDHIKPIKATGIPGIDGKTIMDIRGDFKWEIGREEALSNMEKLGITADLARFGEKKGDKLLFSREGLEQIGILLYPYLSYGILNGGSATSFIDIKKNRSISPELFEILKDYFEEISGLYKGKAKGITPAFINPERSPGPSFMELKMRSLLIEALKFEQKLSGDTVAGNLKFDYTDGDLKPLYPLFQMTSIYNDEQIRRACEEYRNSEMLAPLIEVTGLDITRAETGVQPVIAAFTHSSEGKPKTLFTRAYGKEGELLPLPGGHGRNFAVLKGIYKKLYKEGKRFVYLGNIDNLGYTVDPVSVGLLALSGKKAGFDFSFKTPVDIKGGILIYDQRGKLNCADIGTAITTEEVREAENKGKKILFNCATGLFNLEYLVNNLDYIIDNLPMRFSDQDKEAGKYSQAEQVTWEVIGIMDDFLIFGVNKHERFLAAKLLLETLLTSGIGLDNPDFPTTPHPEKDMRAVAKRLHQGLTKKLQTAYGMKLKRGRWIPEKVERLFRAMNHDGRHFSK